MCGIAGLFSPAPISNERLATAARSMAHRGPDDHGYTVRNGAHGHIGLVNTRLAILDLSARGHQPMYDNDTGNELVFNGEIYNRDELAEQLQQHGIRFQGTTDTEVVLKGYAVWGTEIFRRLRGMFAVALFDPYKSSLLLARDPLGIKPLYWSNDTGELCFASEIRTLIGLRDTQPALNPNALQSYLAFGSVSESRDTVWQGIKIAPPGTLAEITSLGSVEWRPYLSLTSERFSGTYDDAVQETRRQLAFAASRHMLSDVPVGLFLSGGMDSTALAAVLKKEGHDLKTFSLTFKEEAYSEQRYSQEVAAALGTHHTDVTLSVNDALNQIPSFLAAQDQPSIDGLNIFLVSREAHKAGLKVALSGLGGDELFGGYIGFRNIERASSALTKMPSAAAHALARILRGTLPKNHRYAKLTAALQSDGDVQELYALSRELFHRDARAALMPKATADLARQLVTREDLDDNDADVFDEVSVLELRNFALNTLLRDSDVMSMATSLEVRIPFFDTDLVRFVLSVPAAYKKRGAGVKPLLAAAVRDLIPESVVRRKKMGFELPFAIWMRNEMRAEIESTLLDSSSTLDGLLSSTAVAQIWKDFLEGRTSWSRPWSLYVLLQWYALARARQALTEQPA